MDYSTSSSYPCTTWLPISIFFFVFVVGFPILTLVWDHKDDGDDKSHTPNSSDLTLSQDIFFYLARNAIVVLILGMGLPRKILIRHQPSNTAVDVGIKNIFCCTFWYSNIRSVTAEPQPWGECASCMKTLYVTDRKKRVLLNSANSVIGVSPSNVTEFCDAFRRTAGQEADSDDHTTAT